jgi:hypothetical protein
MNPLPENDGSSIVPFAHIGFPDGFEVCWAGKHPFQDGFCFGSLDGRILFTDELGAPLMPPVTGSVSREAINGVARVGIWVAVTTRQEVNFKRLLGTLGAPTSGLAFPYGAHDITITPSGYFLAPLGQTGIMAVQPPFSPETPVTVHSADKAGLYAYRVISLRSQAGVEVLVCAGRLGGIAAGEFSGSRETHTMNTATFKGLDVVDICPLDPGADSLAVAALGRDGSLVLSQDVLQDKKPITMKFQSVKGVAYRVLSCRGDIYLLTSKGMYVLGKLAGRFLAKELVSGVTTPVLAMGLEAVDANLVANRWLLVVMADEVRKFDVELVHQSVPERLGHGEIQEFQETTLSPEWEWRDIEQTTKQVAEVA